MSVISCPNCRSSVSVPPHHTEATIRCGICWTEVSLPRSAPTGNQPIVQPLVQPTKPIAQRLPTRSATPAVAATPAVTAAPAIPSKPAKPITPSAASKPPIPVAAPLPANAKPAAGMARLDAIIHKAAARMLPPASEVTPNTPAKSVVGVSASRVSALPKEAAIPIVEGLPAHGPSLPAPVALPQAPMPTPIAVGSATPQVVPQVVPAVHPPIKPVAINAAPAYTPVPVNHSAPHNDVVELSTDDIIIEN